MENKNNIDMLDTSTDENKPTLNNQKNMQENCVVNEQNSDDVKPSGTVTVQNETSERSLEERVTSLEATVFETQGQNKLLKEEIRLMRSTMNQLTERVYNLRNDFQNSHSKPDVNEQEKPFKKPEEPAVNGHDIKIDESSSWVKGDSIAQSLQSAAEEAMGKTGLVFDDATGLYYDWNVQMYYDHNTQLYYDNDNGIYYSFDQQTNSMKFHSQITVPQTVTTNTNDATSLENEDELSEGEILSEEEETAETAEAQWPPGIRAILLDSPGDTLGSLFLVTYRGGCIGRHPGEVGKHVIILKDPSISKTHAKIKYDTIQETFQLQDLGSVNGTYINEERLSESKEKSVSTPLTHGDRMKVGNSMFLIHIHQGNETCDECEPGQVMAEIARQNSEGITNMTKENSHKTMLQSLKQRYSLNRAADIKKNGDDQVTYHDRAKIRRKIVKHSGGEEPVEGKKNKPNQPIKSNEVADVKREIADSNVGHQMLSKMGWKLGEGLGKNKTGIKNPVTVNQRPKLSGLGSTSVRIPKINQTSNGNKWDKARERYNDIEMAESDKIS